MDYTSLWLKQNYAMVMVKLLWGYNKHTVLNDNEMTLVNGYI